MSIQVGEAIVFHDEFNRGHNALVTVVHGTGDDPCINLLHCSSDVSRQDQYGRQIERRSSVVHVSTQGAAGNYWRKLDEQPKTYQEPAQS